MSEIIRALFTGRMKDTRIDQIGEDGLNRESEVMTSFHVAEDIIEAKLRANRLKKQITAIKRMLFIFLDL